MEPFQLTNMATALLAYPENLESRAQLERDLNQTVVMAMGKDDNVKVHSSLVD